MTDPYGIIRRSAEPESKYFGLSNVPKEAVMKTEQTIDAEVQSTDLGFEKAGNSRCGLPIRPKKRPMRTTDPRTHIKYCDNSIQLVNPSNCEATRLANRIHPQDTRYWQWRNAKIMKELQAAKRAQRAKEEKAEEKEEDLEKKMELELRKMERGPGRQQLLSTPEQRNAVIQATRQLLAVPTQPRAMVEAMKQSQKVPQGVPESMTAHQEKQESPFGFTDNSPER